MDSNHLYYFRTIAQSESLTKAARKLFISQPALSKSLSNLEKELGQTLFDRIGGRLYLNENGRILLEYANEMDELFQKIEHRFQELNQAVHPLKVYAIGNYFSFIMKNYFQNNTQPINLKILPEKALLEALFEQEADAVIADDRYIQPNPDMGLKQIPILSEQMFLMVPKNHELARRKRIHIRELEPYSIMQLNTNLWLPEITKLNNVNLKLSWSVDSETWNYYWNNYEGEVPLAFDTSASFVTREQLQARLQKCAMIQVQGTYTNRMLFLWYFVQKEPVLKNFLECVRNSFVD